MFPPPPEWLVEWTKYLGMVVSLIAAVLALFYGRSLLLAKTKEITLRLPPEVPTSASPKATPGVSGIGAAALRSSPPNLEAMMKEPLDATVLRRAGEAADGRREEVLVFAEGIGGDVIFTTQEDAAAKGLEVKLQVSTGFTQPGLRRKVRLFLLYDNKGLLLEEGVDAVFLTQSAVEKFVLPYYTRTCQPKEIQALRDKLFDDANCIAAPHVPPSVTTGVPGFTPTDEIGIIDERSPDWSPMPSFPPGTQMSSQTAKLSSAGASKQGSSAMASP